MTPADQRQEQRRIPLRHVVRRAEAEGVRVFGRLALEIVLAHRGLQVVSQAPAGGLNVLDGVAAAAQVVPRVGRVLQAHQIGLAGFCHPDAMLARPGEVALGEGLVDVAIVHEVWKVFDQFKRRLFEALRWILVPSDVDAEPRCVEGRPEVEEVQELGGQGLLWGLMFVLMSERRGEHHESPVGRDAAAERVEEAPHVQHRSDDGKQLG